VKNKLHLEEEVAVGLSSIHVLLQLTSINISWCDMMTASGIRALAEGCTKLRTFISKVSRLLGC
jgi:hypothetical protein